MPFSDHLFKERGAGVTLMKADEEKAKFLGWLRILLTKIVV
jgi:hypothetical protein